MKKYILCDASGTITNFMDLADEDAEPEGWVLCPQVHEAAAQIGARWTGSLVQAKPVDPRLWWVDVGPFKDRLGMDGLALSASANDVCKAVKEQLYDRKYVDLKGTQTANLLGMLALNLQPTANVLFPGSGPMTALKIASITGTPTTEAERHIKGLA